MLNSLQLLCMFCSSYFEPLLVKILTQFSFDLLQDDFVYGKYDDHHTYYESEDKCT